MDRSNNSSEISFHGLPSKSKRLVSGNKSHRLVITVNSIINIINSTINSKQPSSERYLANIFLPVLWKTCSALKNKTLFRNF